MGARLEDSTPSELRLLLVTEIRKFITALGVPHSISELESLRDRIKEVYQKLDEKEIDQIKLILGNDFLQLMAKNAIWTKPAEKK